ncbi:alpha/beta hydrolase [Solicola sp. PLA-1-18]|uniref:alpha/beta hydrolase n=1 Tax=Solicola sp. PLA-1-18 TaxID=3380532 RepID=UPI003B82719B
MPAPPRQDVTFASGDGECAAWLYLPDAPTPAPVVVMAHGLGGVREMRLDAFAERFVDAGYAALVLDYRHFGASPGEPRHLLDVDRQLEDWAAAVAHVRSLNAVDAERVVLWGTSFGGGHAIVAAARDQQVAAVVSQCPFTDGLASTAAVAPPVSARLTVAAVRDLVRAVRDRAPHMVPTAGAPGTTALMTAPDAVPGFLRLVPEGMQVRNEVAARVALRITRHRPGRQARRVTCPILFLVCEDDTVAPARATLRHARRAPRGEVRTYAHGHFDVYVGDAFEEVVADQVEFLRRHVPPAG